jgi:hypothetical protein
MDYISQLKQLGNSKVIVPIAKYPVPLLLILKQTSARERGGGEEGVGRVRMAWTLDCCWKGKGREGGEGSGRE